LRDFARALGTMLDDCVKYVGVVLLRALSASLMRMSRACCSVERDSLIRPIAVLSGCMLKLLIVTWMSYRVQLAIRVKIRHRY